MGGQPGSPPHNTSSGTRAGPGGNGGCSTARMWAWGAWGAASPGEGDWEAEEAPGTSGKSGRGAWGTKGLCPPLARHRAEPLMPGPAWDSALASALPACPGAPLTLPPGEHLAASEARGPRRRAAPLGLLGPRPPVLPCGAGLAGAREEGEGGGNLGEGLQPHFHAGP